MCCGGADLFVLLRLLPPPPALQGLPLRAVVHQRVQGLPQHQVAVVEAPHPCSANKKLVYWSERIFDGQEQHTAFHQQPRRMKCEAARLQGGGVKDTRDPPSEAACSRQFPSPLVASGSRLWQFGTTFVHQFRRPA